MRQSHRHVVRIGDVITLESPDLGFISSSGVGCTMRADLLEGGVQMPPNIRECRYQVYPVFRYAGQEALRKLQSEGQAHGSKKNALLQTLQADDQHNRREFDSLFGTEVRYGMGVQLMHLSTQRFVTVSHAIAKLERDCLRVSIDAGEEGSCWTITPIFKFQRSGDVLQYQDNFYLEASRKRGFMHISETSDLSAVCLSSYIKDTFEVNCSHAQSRLRFRPYRDGRSHAARAAQRSGRGGHLFGDDVVTIQMREREALLAAPITAQAPTSPSHRPGPAEAHSLEGLAVIFACPGQGRLRADALWKIESEVVQHAGEAVEPRRPFRVKHVASGLYMSLADPTAEQQEVCLTSDYYQTDGRTLWRLVPVGEEELALSDSTPMFLQSCCSATWLQALDVSSGAPGTQGIQLAACLDEKETSQYVFLVPFVSEGTTTIDRLRRYRMEFDELAGILRCRPDIDEKWAALQTFGESTRDGLGACIRLCVAGDTTAEDPLSIDGEPDEENQHLIHEMGVLESVVDLIGALAEPLEDVDSLSNAETPEEPTAFLSLAYWLIKQASKNSLDAKRALSHHSAMLARHVPLRVNASAALREIFKDNPFILLHVPEFVIKEMLEQLVACYTERRSPRTLRILESMCVCSGAPVPFIQNHLTVILLQQNAESLPRLKAQGRQVRILPEPITGEDTEIDPKGFLSQEGKELPDDLHSGGESDDEKQQKSSRVYRLLLASLELFAAMATGRNALVGAELQASEWHLSRSVLVSALKNPTIPSAFRRACLSLLEHLYIDQGDRRETPAINHTFVWSEAKTPSTFASPRVAPAVPQKRTPPLTTVPVDEGVADGPVVSRGLPGFRARPRRSTYGADVSPTASEGPLQASFFASEDADRGREKRQQAVAAFSMRATLTEFTRKRRATFQANFSSDVGRSTSVPTNGADDTDVLEEDSTHHWDSDMMGHSLSIPDHSGEDDTENDVEAMPTVCEASADDGNEDDAGEAEPGVAEGSECGEAEGASASASPSRWGAAGFHAKAAWRAAVTAERLQKAGRVERSNVESMVSLLCETQRDVTSLLKRSGESNMEHVYFAQQLLGTLRIITEFGFLRLGDDQERAIVQGITDALMDFLALKSVSRAMQRCKQSACEVLKRILAMRTGLRLQRIYDVYEASHSEQEKWKQIYAKLQFDLFETPLISESMACSGDHFADSFLDTLSSGVELSVKSECINLIFMHTFQKADLVQEAQKVIVLAVPEAVRVWKQAQDYVFIFGRLMPKISMEGEENSLQIARACEKAGRLFEAMTALCTPSVESQLEDDDEGTGFSRDVISKHQDVLRDLGVHRCALRILQLPLAREKRRHALDEAIDEVRRDLFVLCHNFLEAFAAHNSRNQELLFQYIPLFMNHIGIRKLDAASTIAAVVQDNTSLVAQMREVDLRVFVQSIAKFGKRARWLKMLQSVIEVKGQWVRRNQNIVLGLLLEQQDLVLELDGDQEGATLREDTKSFAQLADMSPSGIGGGFSPQPRVSRDHWSSGPTPRSAFARLSRDLSASQRGSVKPLGGLDPAVAPGGPRDRSILLREGNMTRLELMVARDQDTGKASFLYYHTSCVELLAYCCAGRNHSNQAKCRNLMPLPLVMSTITSCHMESTGSCLKGETLRPHPGVHADTLRFVRTPFIKFLYHAYVDAAPHELFRGIDLWSVRPTGLAGVFLEEARALKTYLEKLDAETDPAYEHIDFVLCTCLPVFGALVKNFLPKKMPVSVRMYTEAVADCCRRMQESHWRERHVAQVESFFTTVSSLEGDDGEIVDEMMELVDKFERERREHRPNGQEASGKKFRRGFKSFAEGFAWHLGVDPVQVVGVGYRNLVSILTSHEELLGYIAEVVSSQSRRQTDGRFLLKCIRAVRAYLCGVRGSGDDDVRWQAFMEDRVPSDPELRGRQEVVARQGAVGALAAVLSHSDGLVVKEAFLSLMAAFASQMRKPAEASQAALVAYLQDDARRRHFMSACAEHLRSSVQDLKAQEMSLQKRREQHKVAKRVSRRRCVDEADAHTEVASHTGSNTGTDASNWDGKGARDAGTADDQTGFFPEPVSPTSPAHQGGREPRVTDTTCTFELLSVLTFCLYGGHTELQSLVLSSDKSRTAQQEDTLAELVRYLYQSEHLMSFSLAMKNRKPLEVTLQAFRLFREAIRGPNVQAMDALIYQTELVEVLSNLLRHLRYDGVFDDLKHNVRNSILMFLLTLLQNLGPGSNRAINKWTYNDCAQIILEGWEEVYQLARQAARASASKLGGAGKERSLIGGGTLVQLEHQVFLHYVVLAYMADAVGSEELQAQVGGHDEAYRWCRDQCGSVEVLRGGKPFRVHFRNPAICQDFRNHEGFASAISTIVNDCIAGTESEVARPAIFQKKLTQLIRQELLQHKLVGKGFLGVLVRFQNYVLRFPLLVTLLINIWLVIFESLFSKTGSTTAQAAAAAVCPVFALGDAGVCTPWVGDAAGIAAVAPPVPMLGSARRRLLGGVAATLLALLSAAHLTLYMLRFIFVVGTTARYRWMAVEGVAVACSLAGNVLSPFFFVVHMLEFFSGQSAQILLASATLNLGKLGQAGLFMLLTVYLYAVIGFQLFKEKHAEGKCETLLHCAVSYLDGGLTGDGLHEALSITTPHSLFESQIGDWFLQLFAMTFLTIFVQVLMAIFSGVIIDSFGELRDRQGEIAAHLSEPGHLLSQQTHWHYVNFFVFLLCAENDDDELTDLVEHIYNEVQQGSSEWLPYRQNLELQKAQAHEGEEAQRKHSGLDAVREELGALARRVEELCQRMDRVERPAEVTVAAAPSRFMPERDVVAHGAHGASARSASWANLGEDERVESRRSSWWMGKGPSVRSGLEAQAQGQGGSPSHGSVEEHLHSIRAELAALRERRPRSRSPQAGSDDKGPSATTYGFW